MQTFIVTVILSATLFFVIRWLVRTAKGKGGGCSCGCEGCPMKGGIDCHCDAPVLPEIKIEE